MVKNFSNGETIREYIVNREVEVKHQNWAVFYLVYNKLVK